VSLYLFHRLVGRPCHLPQDVRFLCHDHHRLERL